MSTATGRDKGFWPSTLLVWFGFSCLALIYSFYLFGWVHGKSFWFMPGDSWPLLNAARYVGDGALGYVYQGTSSYALPLSFVALAPAASLVDHLGLSENYPYVVPHASAWLILGPYSLLFALPVLGAVRRLAWDLGLRSRLWLVQGSTAVVALLPIYYWGHFEDALALAFVLSALRRFLAKDYLKAALLISIAIAFKQDVAALLPFMFFAAPGGRRAGVLAAACALPAALGGFCLLVDWSDASKALFSPVNLVSQYQGHSLFYLTWLGDKTSQYSRSIGLAAAGLLGWRLRRAQTATEILAAASVILLLRPFFEAINYSYYWAPAFLLAGLAGVSAHHRFRIRDWWWPAMGIVWATPRGTATFQPWWWVGELLILAVVAGQVGSNCGLWADPLEIAVQLIKKIRQAPIFRTMSSGTGTGATTWTR